MGHALLHKVLVQFVQIQTDGLIDDTRRRAGHKRRIDIHHMRVKAIAGIRRHPVLRLQVIICLIPLAECRQIPVFQHTPFGHAGGPGGVEQDKQILRFRRAGKRILFHLRQAGNIFCKQNLSLISLHQVQKLLIRNEKFRVRVLYHKGKPVLGVCRVERLVRGSRLQYAERGKNHIFTPRNEHGHGLLPADAKPRDISRQTVGDLIHLPVSVRSVQIDDGGGVRRAHSLFPEQIHHGFRPVKRHFLPVKTLQKLDVRLRDEGNLIQEFLMAKLLHHNGKAVHQPCHGALLVQIAPVLDLVADVLSIYRHIHRQRRLRRVETQFLHDSLFPCNLVKLEVVSLKSKEDIRLDPVDPADLGERINIRVHAV